MTSPMETATQLRIDLSKSFASPDNLSHNACDITIQAGLLASIDARMEGYLQEGAASSLVLVCDSHTRALFAAPIKSKLPRLASKVSLVSFKAGEESKTLETASILASKLSKEGTDRSGVLLAIGGGVVGDLTGFVASIYKRGIRYFQVPTTLLAQVDSSIGGKTGVDTAWGKNQLGTFFQPRAVFIDPDTLDSLPKSELINGTAEIVKTAIIADKNMFSRLTEMDTLDLKELKKYIARSCSIKAEIVAKDEKEENLRSILNYGHTVGHSLEAASGFSLSHGESVILGMICEAWIARRMEILQQDDYEVLRGLLQKLNSLDGAKIKQGNREKRGRGRSRRIDLRDLLSNKNGKLTKLAFADKKSSRSEIRMSLPERIGTMSKTPAGNYRIPVTKELFEASLRYLREELSGLYLSK